MNRRTARLGAQLKVEISDVIRREMKDPRISTLTSIIGVEVSPDLRLAKVHISVLGTPEEQTATLQGLRAGQGFLRNHLGGRLSLKRIPTLDFQLDQSIERGARILQVLADLDTPPESRPAD